MTAAVQQSSMKQPFLTLIVQVSAGLLGDVKV